MVKTGPFVVSLILLVLAVALGYGVVEDVMNYYDRAGDAATAQARMQTVEYSEVEGTDATVDVDWWEVDMRYVYTVDGTTYTGETLLPDGRNTFGTERKARRFVRSHPPNSTFQVYYVRSNPDRSFVRKGSVVGVLVDDGASLGLSGFFFCLSVYFMLPGLGLYYPSGIEPPEDEDDDADDGAAGDDGGESGSTDAPESDDGNQFDHSDRFGDDE